MILKLLNKHKNTAWERWPDSLKKPLRAISANSDGIANSCTFGLSREYFFRKYGENGASEFVKG